MDTLKIDKLFINFLTKADLYKSACNKHNNFITKIEDIKIITSISIINYNDLNKKSNDMIASSKLFIGEIKIDCLLKSLQKKIINLEEIYLIFVS
jgi:hypothetical protein